MIFEQIILGFGFGLCAGMPLIQWLTNRVWRAKSVSGFRVASGGKFYWVIEDSDDVTHPFIEWEFRAIE